MRFRLQWLLAPALIISLATCSDEGTAPTGVQRKPVAQLTPQGTGGGSAAFNANSSATPDATLISGVPLVLRVTFHGLMDYVAAGVGLRDATGGTINIAGIPSGATVVGAYLYWGYLDDRERDAFRSLTLNGNAVLGTITGRNGDTCWGDTYSFSYRADVTSLVSGNGSYVVGGVAQTGYYNTRSQGATLVVVYKKTGLPYRAVQLWEGDHVVRALNQSMTDAFKGFVAAAPVSAHTTFIMGDGQYFTESVHLVGPAGTQNHNNSFDGSDGNYWDTDTYDVSNLLDSASTKFSATVKSVSFNGSSADCLMWVGQVVAVNTPVGAPKAVIGGPYTGKEGGTTSFDGSASTGTGLTYFWNFGDGKTATGAKPVHRWPDGGLFPVTLAVTGSTGETDVATTDVPVSDRAPSFSAGFTANATVPNVLSGSYASLHISFYDPPTGDRPYTFVIKWGDATQDSLDYPWADSTTIYEGHTYYVPGTKSVDITMTDAKGLSAHHIVKVNVVRMPVRITIMPDTFSLGTQKIVKLVLHGSPTFYPGYVTDSTVLLGDPTKTGAKPLAGDSTYDVDGDYYPDRVLKYGVGALKAKGVSTSTTSLRARGALYYGALFEGDTTVKVNP